MRSTSTSCARCSPTRGWPWRRSRWRRSSWPGLELRSGSSGRRSPRAAAASGSTRPGGGLRRAQGGPRRPDAYTNLVLPRHLGKYRLDRPRRGVRDRAGVGHDPAAGHLRRDPGRLHRPTAGQGRGQGARRAPARHPPAAGDAGLPPRRDQHHRRPGPLRGRPGAGRLRQRRAAQGLASTTSTTWIEQVAPTPTRRRGTPRSPTATRSGSSTSCWPRRSATDELDALLAADNERPRVTLVARPGPLQPRRAAGGADPLLAVRRRARPAATPARCRRSPRAAPACRTRARSWSRVALAEAPIDGRRRAAGSTCAPGPGGKAGAARGAGRRARGRGWSPTRLQPHRADLVRRTLTTGDRRRPGAVGRGRRRRHAGAVPAPAPSTGYWSTRRAPAWVRCAAGPRRAGGDSPTTSLAWCRSSARCSRAALDLVRPGGVVLYATCSPVLAETRDVVGRLLGQTRGASHRSTPCPTGGPRPGTFAGVPRLWPERAGRPAPSRALAAPARHRRDVHGRCRGSCSGRVCP